MTRRLPHTTPSLYGGFRIWQVLPTALCGVSVRCEPPNDKVNDVTAELRLSKTERGALFIFHIEEIFKALFICLQKDQL